MRLKHVFVLLNFFVVAITQLFIHKVADLQQPLNFNTYRHTHTLKRVHKKRERTNTKLFGHRQQETDNKKYRSNTNTTMNRQERNHKRIAFKTFRVHQYGINVESKNVCREFTIKSNLYSIYIYM